MHDDLGIEGYYFYWSKIIHTTIAPPQAFMVRLRSMSGTRPAQNMFLSAKNWVATSPMGNFDKTIVAPDEWMASSFSYSISHSASTTA